MPQVPHQSASTAIRGRVEYNTYRVDDMPRGFTFVVCLLGKIWSLGIVRQKCTVIERDMHSYFLSRSGIREACALKARFFLLTAKTIQHF